MADWPSPEELILTSSIRTDAATTRGALMGVAQVPYDATSVIGRSLGGGEQFGDPPHALRQIVVSESEAEAGVSRSSNASPGTNATLACSSTRSANSTVVSDTSPPMRRPSRPDRFG